jgi:hypothetical protein
MPNLLRVCRSFLRHHDGCLASAGPRRFVSSLPVRVGRVARFGRKFCAGLSTRTNSACLSTLGPSFCACLSTLGPGGGDRSVSASMMTQKCPIRLGPFKFGPSYKKMHIVRLPYIDSDPLLDFLKRSYSDGAWSCRTWHQRAHKAPTLSGMI